MDESDVIFHLAAAVGVRLIVESPVRTIETNVHGTQNVLDAASKKKKLVFTASTSEVYGKSDKVPFHEDADLVLGPTSKGRWSYAASKALDEFLALSYWKEKKLPVVVARFFNTVGPRQTGRYGMVLAQFRAPGARRRAHHRVRHGPAIALFLRRARFRGSCSAAGRQSEQAVGEVVNIGSTEEVSIEDLAHLVKQRTGSNSPITHIALRSGVRAGLRRYAATRARAGKT